MDFFQKLQKTEGGYIFLSHSHKDIDKVRQIRNRLEEDGFEPLCFYLKCLDNADEIEDLIKREIDAREWFVFVNSPNSRESRWVTLEREYIAKNGHKKILTIEIDDEASILTTIQQIKRNLRVYISYAKRDEPLARQIKNGLEEKDYQVFFPPDSIPAGGLFTDIAENAIAEASQAGCVAVLITENSMRAKWMEYEIAEAISQRGNLLPIIVGDVKFDMDNPLWRALARYNGVALPTSPTKEMIDKMIDQIGDMITHDEK